MTTIGSRLRTFMFQGPFYSTHCKRSGMSKKWYFVNFEACKVAGVAPVLRHPLVPPKLLLRQAGESDYCW